MADPDLALKGQTRKRPDGWWYPYIFVGFMLVVFVVNGFMMTMAVTTFSGLETDNHYRKGQAYNANIDKVKAIQALGWTAVTEFPAKITGDNLRGGPLTLTIEDAAGVPVTGARVRVAFVRPTHEGHDQKLPLIDKGNGRYGTDVALPLAGQWDLRILAERGDDRFQDIQRIHVP